MRHQPAILQITTAWTSTPPVDKSAPLPVTPAGQHVTRIRTDQLINMQNTTEI